MNRINLILLLICLAGLALSAGCEDSSQKKGKFTAEQMSQIPLAGRADQPARSDGLTLSVKSETITTGQIVTPVMNRLKILNVPADSSRGRFRERAKPVVEDVVTSKITDILLYQEAMKDAPENIDELLDSEVENEINRFLASYGNNHALAQEAIAKRGMNWKQYRELQKKFLLTRQYYISQSLLDIKPVSHSQMLERYEEMQQDDFQFKDPNEFKGTPQKKDVKRDGYVVFRLIDIYIEPDKVEIKDGETCKDAAFRKARMLIDRIKKGEDFGELAKVHSDDPYCAPFGGLRSRVSEGSGMVPPHHVLPPLADKMEVGEVAGPVESDGHIFIMKLEQKSKSWVAPFESLQARIELDIQLEQRAERLNKHFAKLMKRAKISGLDRFINVCVEKAWSRWNADKSLSSK